MEPHEMRYWTVTIDIRWSAGASWWTGSVSLNVHAKDEGHAIAVATEGMLRLGYPDEVYGARAMLVPG